MSKPRTATVEVHLHPGEDPPFELKSSDLNKGDNGEFIFKNDHHPGFHVHFDIQEPNHGFLFPRTAKRNDAVWSELGNNGCPGPNVWEVFQPIRVSPNRKKLVVDNPNIDPVLGPFGFVLRVTDDDSDTYWDLDPGGDNQNGPTQPFMEYLTAPLITGLVVGLGTVTLLRGSFVPDSTALIFGIGGALVGLLIGFLLRRM